MARAHGAKVVVELHGDWRTATRLYGSPLRRALSPLADAVGAFGLRRADAVRTVSSYTSGLVRELGVEPAREFAAFMDLELFLERPPVPLPARAGGALRRRARALQERRRPRPRVAPRRAAAARARSCGSSAAARSARSSSSSSATCRRRRAWTERLTQEEVARALDEATCLVLPSRSEGLGRVLVEAFLRGRPVGRDGRRRHPRRRRRTAINGLLVETDEELADALVRVLSDRELAERLAAGARHGGRSAGSRRRSEFARSRLGRRS